MSAGQKEEHYIQDACELYFVAKSQEYLEKNNINFTNSYDKKNTEFLNYIKSRNIESKFNESEYKRNVDCILSKFCDQIYENKNIKFDIICVEKQARNESKKTDFQVLFEDNSVIDFSFKNYQNGIKESMQVCSGTWVSFLCNIFLDSAKGVGKFTNPINNKTFYPGRANSKNMRDLIFDSKNLQNVKTTINDLEIIKEQIRDYYVNNSEANNWINIEKKWKEDCNNYGTQAAKKVYSLLNESSIDKKSLKDKLIKMSGLDGKEEILLIGKQEFVSSLNNKCFKNFINIINSDFCSLSILCDDNQTVTFLFHDHEKEYLKISVPFTLQKNGAWHCPKDRYNGKQFHTKEKIDLEWGQRRPKKSKEINTSINTWVSLKNILE